MVIYFSLITILFNDFSWSFGNDRIIILQSHPRCLKYISHFKSRQYPTYRSINITVKHSYVSRLLTQDSLHLPLFPPNFLPCNGHAYECPPTTHMNAYIQLEMIPKSNILFRCSQMKISKVMQKMSWDFQNFKIRYKIKTITLNPVGAMKKLLATFTI